MVGMFSIANEEPREAMLSGSERAAWHSNARAFYPVDRCEQPPLPGPGVSGCEQVDGRKKLVRGAADRRTWNAERNRGSSELMENSRNGAIPRVCARAVTCPRKFKFSSLPSFLFLRKSIRVVSGFFSSGAAYSSGAGFHCALSGSKSRAPLGV